MKFSPGRVVALLAGVLVLLLLVQPVTAAPITWTTWTPTNAGGPDQDPGTAQGTIGGVNVTYTGELFQVVTGVPSWNPPSTFSNGTTIDNPPPSSGGIVELDGGTTTVDTVTFSVPVTDPVMAIWSLGQNNATGQRMYVFTVTEPFTIESGGPSQEFGGSTITTDFIVTVFGSEGNGTVQFNGTFTSISWTNPEFEAVSGFTFGLPPQPATVPLPASLVLVGMGLVGIRFSQRRRA